MWNFQTIFPNTILLEISLKVKEVEERLTVAIPKFCSYYSIILSTDSCRAKYSLTIIGLWKLLTVLEFGRIFLLDLSM